MLASRGLQWEHLGPATRHRALLVSVAPVTPGDALVYVFCFLYTRASLTSRWTTCTPSLPCSSGSKRTSASGRPAPLCLPTLAEPSGMSGFSFSSPEGPSPGTTDYEPISVVVDFGDATASLIWGFIHKTSHLNG